MPLMQVGFNANVGTALTCKSFPDFGFSFVFIDLTTGIYRLTFKTVQIFGILKSSEHIDYLSLRSLEVLIKSINGSIIASDSKDEYR